MLKVAVLVSGGGSNLQSILDYKQDSFKVEMVIGSKDGIYGLERAKNAGVPSYVVSRKEYGDEVSNKILELTKGKVDLIVLAGYLSILDGEILKVFKQATKNTDSTINKIKSTEIESGNIKIDINILIKSDDGKVIDSIMKEVPSRKDVISITLSKKDKKDIYFEEEL